MPETSLITTNLTINNEYIAKTCKLCEKEDEDEEDDYIFDKHQFITPGITLTMHYTQSINYKLTEKTVKVTVISIRTIIEGCCCSSGEVFLLGCVLKPNEPIFVAGPRADLSRPITLHTDTLPIATGSIEKI